jgi:hypothetical protein
MNNDCGIKSFTLPETVRLLLWIVLLLLTSAIHAFPVNLDFEYHAVESVYIFGDNLWLSVLYLYYGCSIVTVAAKANQPVAEGYTGGHNLLLSSSDSVIITPYGSYADGLVNMGHVKYLSETGSIAFDHTNLAYFQYPGLHLTGFALSEISGLEIMEIRPFFLLFCRVLLSILLYLLFARSIKNPQMSSLAVLVLVSGAMLITRTMFHAGVTAIIFFVILLYFLVKGGRGL